MFSIIYQFLQALNPRKSVPSIKMTGLDVLTSLSDWINFPGIAPM